MSFFSISDAIIEQVHQPRAGETKIAASIERADLTKQNISAKYVIIGIKEDIGPRANLGRRGADEAWEAFLQVFLNMQNNQTIQLNDFALLGYFDFSERFGSTENIEQLREQVKEIDAEVYALIKKVFELGKIPIVIGGGHNNAYPLMKAWHHVYKNTNLGVLNLDPHADFRSQKEGRHSGNSFSTAMDEQILSNYAVMGLHKSYNSEQTLSDLDKNNCAYYFFDDIVSGTSSLGQQFESSVAFLNECDGIGVELDLDSIKNMPVSAMTPSGISIEDARSYITQNLFTWGDQAAYYHFPEGAPIHAENGNKIVGKTLAYLVYDLMSASL